MILLCSAWSVNLASAVYLESRKYDAPCTCTEISLYLPLAPFTMALKYFWKYRGNNNDFCNQCSWAMAWGQLRSFHVFCQSFLAGGTTVCSSPAGNPRMWFTEKLLVAEKLSHPWNCLAALGDSHWEHNRNGPGAQEVGSAPWEDTSGSVRACAIGKVPEQGATGGKGLLLSYSHLFNLSLQPDFLFKVTFYNGAFQIHMKVERIATQLKQWTIVFY